MSSPSTKNQLTKGRGEPRSSPSKLPAKNSHPAGGFGLMFLLLAAMSRDDGLNQALNPNPECGNLHPNMATAANLRYCASFMEARMRRAAEQLAEDEVQSEDDDEARRRRQKLRASRESESDNESIDITSSRGLTSNDDELASSFSSVEVARSTLSSCDDNTLSTVMSYLTVRDMAQVRRVSHRFNQVAEARMPGTAGMIFLRFGEETHRGSRFEVAPHRHLLRWSCGYCSTPNAVGMASCRHCGGGADEGVGVRRVFFGQLRKERTAELISWLIAETLPEVEVFHVENHTSSPEGRGKGCAWVFVTNPQDEQRLITLNKRMFVDVDETSEGVWYCADSNIDELNQLAASHAYKSNRPIVLPRQPLVVERPQAKATGCKQETSSRRWARLPKGRTAQDLYEESTGAPQQVRVGFPLSQYPADTPRSFTPPEYDQSHYTYPSFLTATNAPTSSRNGTCGHGYRFVDQTHYVHDPYSSPAIWTA